VTAITGRAKRRETRGCAPEMHFRRRKLPIGDTGHGRAEAAQPGGTGAVASPRRSGSSGSPTAGVRLHSRAVGGSRTRTALVALALCAGLPQPALADDPPDGVALVDSCGTYVRMREGAEGYQASQLERTRLCSDLLWTAAEELKAQVLDPGDRPPNVRKEYVRCEVDPRPMGPHQSVRVAYHYLTRHPERLHLPARELAGDALRATFRCEPATGE
jgi:hypothetical protein